MSYDFINALILILAVLLFSTVSGHSQTLPKTKSAAIFLTAGDIGGAWKLNDEESDDAVARVALMMATKSDDSQGKNTDKSDLPSITISLFHPDSIVLATGNDDELTINQTYSDFIQTRTIKTDGAIRYYEITPGAMYSVTANRQKNALKIETVSPRGNKMIETFKLLSAGKLSAAMRIENPQGEEIITMHRVYDRTILDILSNSDVDFQ